MVDVFLVDIYPRLEDNGHSVGRGKETLFGFRDDRKENHDGISWIVTGRDFVVSEGQV